MSAIKTFVPLMVKLARLFCAKRLKHDAVLHTYLSSTQYAAMVAACTALETFYNLVSVPAEEP